MASYQIQSFPGNQGWKRGAPTSAQAAKALGLNLTELGNPESEAYKARAFVRPDGRLALRLTDDRLGLREGLLQYEYFAAIVTLQPGDNTKLEAAGLSELKTESGRDLAAEAARAEEEAAAQEEAERKARADKRSSEADGRRRREFTYTPSAPEDAFLPVFQLALEAGYASGAALWIDGPQLVYAGTRGQGWPEWWPPGTVITPPLDELDGERAYTVLSRLGRVYVYVDDEEMGGLRPPFYEEVAPYLGQAAAIVAAGQAEQKTARQFDYNRQFIYHTAVKMPRIAPSTAVLMSGGRTPEGNIRIEEKYLRPVVKKN